MHQHCPFADRCVAKRHFESVGWQFAIYNYCHNDYQACKVYEARQANMQVSPDLYPWGYGLPSHAK